MKEMKLTKETGEKKYLESALKAAEYLWSSSGNKWLDRVRAHSNYAESWLLIASKLAAMGISQPPPQHKRD
jgi:hypothetical protein